MEQLLITIVGGLAVIIIASWLGFGGTTRVVVTGGMRASRFGKWLSLISGIVLFFSWIWFMSEIPTKGLDSIWLLVGLLALVFLIIGRIINWFQN